MSSPDPAPTPPRKKTPPNRVVAVATVVLALLTALAPVVLNLDWTSTAGIIASLAVVATTAVKWLDGWQKFETAGYQFDLTQQHAEMQLAVIEGEAAAAAEIGGARKSPKPYVPGR
jgi:protein-S-isoprenylcysteine O-methyltransferase Ste14